MMGQLYLVGQGGSVVSGGSVVGSVVSGGSVVGSVVSGGSVIGSVVSGGSVVYLVGQLLDQLHQVASY